MTVNILTPRTRRPAASEFQALPWSTEAEMAELYVAVASKDNVAVKVCWGFEIGICH